MTLRRARGLRLFLGVIAALFVFLVGLHTPPAKRTVAALLANSLSSALEMSVTVSELDYQLWNGTATLGDVRILGPQLNASSPRVEVRFGPASGLQVRVFEPDVRMTANQSKPPTAETDRQPWTSLLRLSAAEIIRGSMRYTTADGSAPVELDGINVLLSRTGNGLGGNVHVDSALIAAGAPIAPISVDTRIEITSATGALAWSSTRLRGAGIDVEVDGELSHVNPLAMQARFGGVIDAALVSAAVPQSPLTISGSHPIRVRGRLENDRLLADAIEVEMFGGALTARGTAGLTDRLGEMAITMRNVDAAAVMSALGSPVAVASRVDAEVAVKIRDWNPELLNGSGLVELRSQKTRGVPIAGAVRLAINERTITGVAERLTIRDVTVGLDAKAVLGGEVAARYSLQVPAVERLPVLLADMGIAASTGPLTGAVAVEGTVAGRFPELVSVARVSSENVGAYGMQAALDGSARITREHVEIVSLTASGDRVEAGASGFIPLMPNGHWKLSGDVKRLDLADVLADRGIAATAVTSGSFSIDGARSNPMLRVALDTDVADTAIAAEHASLKTLAHASRDGVVLERATGTGAGGTLAMSGSWKPGSGAIEARLQADRIDVRRLPGFTAPLRDISSALSMTGEIAGSLSAPSGRARVNLVDTKFRDVELGTVQFDVTADGVGMDLSGTIGGRAFVSGRGTVVSPWPVDLTVDLAALPLADVVRAIPSPTQPISEASLVGHANIRLSLGAPSSFEYESDISSASIRVNREWRAASFSVSGDRNQVQIRGLDLRSGDSRFAVDGALGIAEPSGTVTVTGHAQLAEIASLLPATGDGAGEADVDLRIGGSMASPIVTGTIGVRDGALSVAAVKIAAIQIEAIAEDSVFSIKTATARVSGGEVRLTGALPLGSQVGQPPRQLQFTIRGLDLATLADTSAARSDLSVPIDLDGQVTLSGLTLDAVDASGVLTRMAVVAGTDRHDLDAPVSWTFARGALAHTPLRLRGAKGDMTLATSLNVSNGAVQFAATGTGTVDLSIANAFLGGAGVVGGTLTFDTKLSRTAGRWAVSGGANVSDGRVVLKSPRLAVTDLKATLRADGDRIELTDATAAMGDGKIVADGTATIKGTDVDVNVRLNADRVPLEYPEGLRTRSSGEIRITGTTAATRVTGDLVVHRAIYEREIDLTAQALDSAAAIVGGINEPKSALARTELALTLRLEEGLRIATSKATLVIDGAMRINGTAETPELDGSLGIREGGTVRVSRALVRLQGGRIELRGYPERPTEIDIKGVTQVTGVRIDVGLSGSLDDVRMSLSSSNRTDLSQGDLAALILTGRTATDAAADSGAVIVEELAAALGQSLDKGLGGPLMIDVSRDESLIVEDTDPSQRLNIGVPLNSRLYVIYSRSLDRDAVRWIVDFRPGGDFRVRGISNDDGSEAIEVSHRFGFDVWSRKYRVSRIKEAPLKIGRVTVNGAPGQTEAELRSRLKLKTGETFDYFKGEEAAKRARDWLVEEGYLTAAVDVSEARRENELDLAVRIDAGPRIIIEWRGDDAGRGERKRVNGGWGTFLPLEDTAAQLARDVRNRLRARGYYHAVVTAELQSNPGESHAVFDVRRGEKIDGVTLTFDGNASIPRSTLAAVVPASDRPEFFEYLEVDRAQRVSTAIRLAYAREGFLQVQVGASVARMDPATNRLVVTIPIQEGPRATVRAFDLPSELTTIKGTEPNFKLRAGDPFRLDAYNADRTRLLTWYRDEGFADARVHGIVEPIADGVVVRLRAEPGPRVLVASVRSAHDSHTRESVVAGAVGLNGGDIVRARDLDEARTRLSETRIFRSVDVRLEPSATDSATRDVVVDLSERTDINTEYSLRYTTAGSSEVSGSPSESDAGLQVGGAAELVNPFGWAARYRVYALYGAERRMFGARYESATFFGRRWETQVFLFDDRDRVEDIEVLGERVQGITFQQTKRWRTALDGRRLHDRLRLQWGYTFKYIRYRDLETGNTLGGYRAGPIVSLVSDSRDSVTDPHRGLFWSVGTETALSAVGSDVNYLKVFGQLFFYTSLTPRITWAQSFRIGAVPGDDPLLLLERRFTAGGASSVRGFEEKALSPTGPEGTPIGGQAMAVFNQELRFPLWKRLFGGVFYDAGNAFLLASDLDLGALRHSAGVGLRVMFPFGPVRFDWSGVINPHEGETRSRFLFSIGHVF